MCARYHQQQPCAVCSALLEITHRTEHTLCEWISLYALSLVLEVFSLENPLESAFFSKTENARQCAVLFALLKIDQKLVIIDGSMSCVSAIFLGPVRLTRKEMSL